MAPEVQHIAVTLEAGPVAVLQFVTKSREFVREATDEAIEQEIVRSQLKAKSWRRITPEDVPTDRTFRNAWRDDGSIGVDMDKARSIHMDRIRSVRNAALASLDAEWMKAKGQKDDATADRAELKRQSLRDIPQTFDLTNATTPDELKALWPDSLPK